MVGPVSPKAPGTLASISQAGPVGRCPQTLPSGDQTWGEGCQVWVLAEQGCLPLPAASRVQAMLSAAAFQRPVVLSACGVSGSEGGFCHSLLAGLVGVPS